jgi:hypothetical protein
LERLPLDCQDRKRSDARSFIDKQGPHSISKNRRVAMLTKTATVCVLTFVVATAAQSSAQEPPPAVRPPVADPGTPAEPKQTGPADLGPTRLFLAPTARSLPRGKGSCALTEIAFPWGEVGLTDRVSVRVFVLPPLEDVSSGGVAIGPKVQLYGGARVQAAVGAVQLFSTSQGDSGGLGAAGAPPRAASNC